MSSLLYTLGRSAFRARRRVLAVWLGVLVLFLAGAAFLSHGTDNTFTIPGTESQNALDALARTFPQVSGASAQLIAKHRSTRAPGTSSVGASIRCTHTSTCAPRLEKNAARPRTKPS